MEITFGRIRNIPVQSTDVIAMSANITISKREKIMIKMHQLTEYHDSM